MARAQKANEALSRFVSAHSPIHQPSGAQRVKVQLPAPFLFITLPPLLRVVVFSSHTRVHRDCTHRAFQAFRFPATASPEGPPAPHSDSQGTTCHLLYCATGHPPCSSLVPVVAHCLGHWYPVAVSFLSASPISGIENAPSFAGFSFTCGYALTFHSRLGLQG